MNKKIPLERHFGSIQENNDKSNNNYISHILLLISAVGTKYEGGMQMSWCFRFMRVENVLAVSCTIPICKSHKIDCLDF